MAVCADEAEEPVEIPTEADGELVPLIFQPFFGILTLSFLSSRLNLTPQAQCCSHQ